MPTFKKIEYKNVQSIGNHPMKIQLDRSPTTVVGGQNGTGKSTLGYALTYALYGKFPNGAKLADAINSVNKKNLYVKVEFTQRGSDYIVVRGEKPKKFEIYKDDDMLDQSANARDQQKMLDAILGMDYQMFTQLVMLNKEQYEPFMSLPVSGRRKIVETILDISIFSYMNDVVKNNIKDKKQELDTNEREFTTVKVQLESTQELIDSIRESMADKTEEIKEAIEEGEGKLKKLQEKMELIADRLENEFNDEEDTKELNTEMKELEKYAMKYRVNIDNNKSTLEFFSDKNNCPTCEQEIDEDFKSKKISETEAQNIKLKEKIEEANSLLEIYKEKIEEANRIQAEKREISNEMKYALNEYTIFENTVKSLKKKMNSTSDESRLTKAEAQFNELTEKLDGIREKNKELEDKYQIMDRLRVALKDDGVKSVIVKEYINLVNKKVNEYLQAMDFYINIQLDENFNEKFNALNKENFTMSNLSTGQKARVNLAIWLALLEVASIKNSVVSNVLFIDEVLENLDAQGVSDFMKLCREMLPEKNVFVVTQRFDEFEDHFLSSIKFKLNQGFTEIA